MNQEKTTFFGRRVGYNEQKRKDDRNQKIKSGVARIARWFKKGGWVLLLLMIAGAILMWQQRFYIQHFNPLELRQLQYVEIEGNRMLSWEDVMQNAQIETGMSMSELDADSVRERLMQMPMINTVDVQKKFPSALFIKLQETSPVVSVLLNGKAVVYSEKGIPLPHSMATAMRLPVLYNESLDRVGDIAKFLNAMRVADKKMYEDVSQVGWSDADAAIEIFFRDVSFKVLFSKDNLNKEDFMLYESLKARFMDDLHCAGEVDMRFAGFAYVRNYDKRCVNG
ncbi:MAG: FtsQ-type POTRA domain-containing protein [Fibrobacter sp.]|nr:FtsQ-type POTRA domain-containing protein [Fibrobacter sp.]